MHPLRAETFPSARTTAPWFSGLGQLRKGKGTAGISRKFPLNTFPRSARVTTLWFSGPGQLRKRKGTKGISLEFPLTTFP